jgi:hypothetical protein
MLLQPFTLKGLVGKHKFSGYWEGQIESSNAAFFIFDDIVYCISEDEDDGYRSSMKELLIAIDTPRLNVFEPVDVRCVLESEELVVADVITGKDVLRVGTDTSDRWYPSFITNFTLENLSLNRGV